MALTDRSYNVSTGPSGQPDSVSSAARQLGPVGRRFDSEDLAPMRLRPDSKTCTTCGKSFEIRPQERPATFRLRSRCAFTCRPVTRPVQTGRARALALYPLRPCEVCGVESRPDYAGPASRIARHHRDGDQMNNAAVNIAFLCKEHHDLEHQRMAGVGIGRRAGGPRPRIAALQHERALSRYAAAVSLISAGHSVPQIAQIMGFHPASVQRWFDRYGPRREADNCPICGRTISGRRSARYCSTVCKQRAYFGRHREEVRARDRKRERRGVYAVEVAP